MVHLHDIINNQQLSCFSKMIKKSSCVCVSSSGWFWWWRLLLKVSNNETRWLWWLQNENWRIIEWGGWRLEPLVKQPDVRVCMNTLMADGHASAGPGTLLTQLWLAWSTRLLVSHHTNWSDMPTPTGRRCHLQWQWHWEVSHASDANTFHLLTVTCLKTKKMCFYLQSTCDRVHCCSYF